MPNIKPICLRYTAVCHRSPAAVEPGSMSLGGGSTPFMSFNIGMDGVMGMVFKPFWFELG